MSLSAFRFPASVIHAFCLGSCLLVSGLSGCGGGDEPAPSEPAAGNAPAADSTPAESEPKTANSDKADSQDNSAEDRKYVDGIPYDVFYDQPLTVAAENQTVVSSNPLAGMGTSPGNTVATNTPPAKPEPEPTPTASNEGSREWKEIISQELLLEEVMRLRNALTASLQSVGSFNRELLNIQADASVLAALAGVATEHDGDFTWKDKAKYVRDMSYTIAMAAESRGRPAYETAEGPFLNIVEILSGGSPAELPDSADETSFSEIAERNMLMKQVKINADWLQTTISTEEDLKNKKDDVISKATILATIGSVIAEEDYVFADEENYQSYCRELIEGSLKVVDSAKNDDYEGFQQGFDLMNKSCSDCHPEYLN